MKKNLKKVKGDRMNQLYTGEITACYLNISKQNKEYSVGYIRLPDETGNFQTYKFLVFKSDIVSKIKDFGPENLKGKTIGLVGVFAQNTYNGVTEFQLTVNDIQLENAVVPSEQIPTNQPSTQQPQMGVPEPVNNLDIPTVPNF